MTPITSAFWPGVCTAALLLLWFAVIPCVQCARQKRYALLLCGLTMAGLAYFVEQSVVYVLSQSARTPAVRAIVRWMQALPPWITVGMLILTMAGIAALLLSTHRFEKSRITSASVKEAVDSLPAGLCVYLPGGRVVMVNRAMEQFCLRTCGGLLINGEAFRDRLLEGELLPGCSRTTAEGMVLIVLEDGSAWAAQEKEVPYAGFSAHRLLVSEVTETYRKTLSLQKMQSELKALNERLTDYNQEIVELTAEKELLNARVRLHDQMGEDLLTMKQYLLQGGTEQQRKEIESMLRRNVTFLKTGHSAQRRDEYALMLETAEKLGVRVSITGALPQGEKQKHVIATALHECITNTLRHAQGDALFLRITEQGDMLRAVFTNNGCQPEGDVQEKGGLSSLRILTEDAGGRMTLCASPVFSVTLLLPKEVTS